MNGAGIMVARGGELLPTVGATVLGQSVAYFALVVVCLGQQLGSTVGSCNGLDADLSGPHPGADYGPTKITVLGQQFGPKVWPLSTTPKIISNKIAE